MRRHRQRAAEADRAALDEAPALALRAEAEVLELDDHGDGEAVVELGDVDVGGRDARHRERVAARLHRAGRGDVVVLADVGVREAVALAEQVDRPLAQVARPRALVTTNAAAPSETSAQSSSGTA